jgi:ferric-dicitrate binding protein FerR (iron transport regulator)
MPIDDLLEAQILRYLDRTGSSAESAALERRLATDPAARECFVLVSLMRTQLPRALRPARRRRRTLRLAGAAAVALVLVALGARALLSHAAGRPAAAPTAIPLARAAPHVEAAGVATIAGAGGERTISGSAGLATGETLALAPDAAAVITWTDEATVMRLAGGGRLRWLGESEGKRIELSHGALELTVAGQPAGRPLVIRTANAAVTVVGTRLRIDAGTGATAVAVSEGMVEVERSADHARLRLEAGRRCAVLAAAPLSAEPIPPAADRLASLSRADDRRFALAGGGAHASIATVPGPFAATAAALDVTLPREAAPAVSDWPWAAFSVVLAAPQDWSQARTLAFWFAGGGDGRELRIELEGAHPPGGDAGSNPRYVASFTDSSAQWRRIELPLAGFAPRQDVPVPAAPHWDRREVNAVNLVVAPARAGRWVWADLEIRR